LHDAAGNFAHLHKNESVAVGNQHSRAPFERRQDNKAVGSDMQSSAEKAFTTKGSRSGQYPV
jgi:hypothetical protein